MISRVALVLALGLASCSRLDTLKPEAIDKAEKQWKDSGLRSYRLVVEMGGDRVEKGTFEVKIRNGSPVSLKRNGQELPASRGEDYSVEGLFKTVRQEMELAKKPELLGAPAGYTVYTLARFDEASGRLAQYRRSVGGTRNAIDIAVREFEMDDSEAGK